jgi:hypothetical protein
MNIVTIYVKIRMCNVTTGSWECFCRQFLLLLFFGSCVHFSQIMIKHAGAAHDEACPR